MMVPSFRRTLSTSLDKLTDRQQQVFDLIYESAKTKGYQPSMREIAAHLGITSLHGVAGHIKALQRKGWIGETHGARAVDLSKHL